MYPLNVNMFKTVKIAYLHSSKVLARNKEGQNVVFLLLMCTMLLEPNVCVLQAKSLVKATSTLQVLAMPLKNWIILQ